MTLPDWEQLWNAELIVSDRLRLDGGAYWDQPRRSRGRGGFPEALTAAQLDVIGAGPGDTVLEVGPGEGRLTFPLAARATALTAIDASVGMVQRLRETTRLRGVGNVTLIHGDWKDVGAAGEIAPHDVVVASYCLFMPDIARHLQRLVALATRRVALFVPAEPRVPRAIQELLHGRRVSAEVGDHMLLFNLLHGMGIEADVVHLSFPVETRYAELAEAVEAYGEFWNVPSAGRERLSAFVSTLGVNGDDGGFTVRRVSRTGALVVHVA